MDSRLMLQRLKWVSVKGVGHGFTHQRGASKQDPAKPTQDDCDEVFQHIVGEWLLDGPFKSGRDKSLRLICGGIHNFLTCSLSLNMLVETIGAPPKLPTSVNSKGITLRSVQFEQNEKTFVFFFHQRHRA